VAYSRVLFESGKAGEREQGKGKNERNRERTREKKSNLSQHRPSWGQR